MQPDGSPITATEAEETEVFDPEEDEDEVELGPPSAEESLRYFGVDFDVEGLVRRFDRKELIVPRFDPEEPDNKGTGYSGFQRAFVWGKRQMDRFIESILLGYPVPGIFLVELRNRQYLVLDGQQRLTTLQAFYKGEVDKPDGGTRPFTLEYAAEPFKGKSYETLEPADRRVLNNALIQATVTLPVGESGKLAIYTLFERINSGGTQLKEQQIRVAIFPGHATKLIRSMNRDANWRLLFGPRHRDLRDQELILRYLSLKSVAEKMREEGKAVGSKKFTPPMASFMSAYLSGHEVMPDEEQEQEKGEFASACKLLVEAAGKDALRRNRVINAARADSILAGLTLAIRDNPSIDAAKVMEGLEKLERNEDYLSSTQKSTSHRTAVANRLAASLSAFAGH
ncbi:DUF262 domain-containing protein [Streptomyces sp. Act143]|uniref:DUF262 domain-containing protein n=1 Tax=Streptomyces sp. Act143 TaxID=2200760 RepID=UPI000D672E59|nr:DUF262 domain-containing protein [Streptomyces sp. Act143]PWI18161.1 DUF262 domain-containing protein [Streptomyces sp. Act143]